MKKTFPLHIEGKHPDRVLDRVKHEVRKYIKRERSRALPEGVDFWDFDCQFGLSADTAESVHLANLITCIDSAAKAQAQQVYVAVLAKHGVRAKRAARLESEEASVDPSSEPSADPQG